MSAPKEALPVASGEHNGEPISSAPWMELFEEFPCEDIPIVSWGAYS